MLEIQFRIVLKSPWKSMSAILMFLSGRIVC